MAISIDWPSGVITVNRSDMTLIQTTPFEVYNLDVDDFRRALKDLEDDPIGMSFADTHRHNPPVTFGGVTVARTVEILAPYTVTFENASYAVNLIGANNNVADVTNLNNVSVRSANSAGLLNENQEDVEFLAYWNDSVWVDQASANAGTSHPVGTTRAPVNNFSDAQAIADARGLFNITIRSDSTIDTTTHNRVKFYGRSPRTSTLTVTSGATLTACEFEALLLTGDLGANGSSYSIGIAIKDCAGLFGHFERCVLREGTNTLAADGIAMLNKCAFVGAASPGAQEVALDMNGSGRVAMRECQGEITLKNCDGSGGANSLAMNGGTVTLDSTITGGVFRVFGVGTLIDNSAGATVDSDELVSPAGVWGETLENNYSAADVVRLVSAVLLGRVTGAGTGTETFIGIDDTTNRVVAEIDGNYNRSSVTLDPS